MLTALFLVPAIAGLSAFLLRRKAFLRLLLLVTAWVHLALTVQVWLQGAVPAPGSWLELDALGRIFLGVTSLLFVAAAGYAASVLGGSDHHYPPAHHAGFVGGLLLFLATMTLVTMSQHLGLLWVAVEATTLASAPLIYFHRSSRSLEATWKYLVICSVGIALALLGNFSLAVALAPVEGGGSMLLRELVTAGPRLLTPWVRVAFVFFLVGYGTKMGLAPLHTWLPDAHSEAPSPVSALLSGALLNCAFLGILRSRQVCLAAGLADFGQDSLLALGLLSMLVAAVFLIGQTDYKRMLAYSSVEHMGILAVAVGLGGSGIFAGLLHAVNHSLVKAALFLTAGNTLEATHTKNIGAIRGLRLALPLTGGLWMAGFLAVVGSPPFGTFISEFLVVAAALQQGHPWVAVAFLALLLFAFMGMAGPVLGMVLGVPGGAVIDRPVTDQVSLVLPAVLLLALALVLGLWLPAPLVQLLREAAAQLGG